MSHDPLCPADAGKPLNVGCAYCDWVFKVRKDEREKAAQRVAKIEDHWSACPEWAGEPCNCGTGRLIAAVRGEA